MGLMDYEKAMLLLKHEQQTREQKKNKSKGKEKTKKKPEQKTQSYTEALAQIFTVKDSSDSDDNYQSTGAGDQEDQKPLFSSDEYKKQGAKKSGKSKSTRKKKKNKEDETWKGTMVRLCQLFFVFGSVLMISVAALRFTVVDM